MVLIPFIAGQWSLHGGAPTPAPTPGLNPLHCGAVVASGRNITSRTVFA